MTRRLVYICDWLPPDFGAVGQYAMLFARQWASEGWAVTLVGLTSGEPSRHPAEPIGDGSVEILKIHRNAYEKRRFASRSIWTVRSNVALLAAAFGRMRQADAVLFTGSPPLMLHFIAPLNVLLGRRLIYRITDFHPECLIAERSRASFGLNLLLRLTQFWRRRIHQFEVLGLDQARRLVDNGIKPERIVLKRDPSPVEFTGRTPLAIPDDLRRASGVLLYSGNWGVAHDERTFIEGYAKYIRRSPNGLGFWLNATGVKADRVDSELRARGVAVHRSALVPLEDLPRLLLAADVHLITLRDAFVGYVLPSKVHACIESGRRIIFIGSEDSDVHLLASEALPPGRYRRVDVGDVDGLADTLEDMARAVAAERKSNAIRGEISLVGETPMQPPMIPPTYARARSV